MRKQWQRDADTFVVTGTTRYCMCRIYIAHAQFAFVHSHRPPPVGGGGVIFVSVSRATTYSIVILSSCDKLWKCRYVYMVYIGRACRCRSLMVCVCVSVFFSSFDILLLLCSLIAMWARSAILSLSLICDLQWNTRQEFSSILDCCSWCRKAFPDTHTVQTAIQVPQHHQQQQQWQQQIQFI